MPLAPHYAHVLALIRGTEKGTEKGRAYKVGSYWWGICRRICPLQSVAPYKWSGA